MEDRASHRLEHTPGPRRSPPACVEHDGARRFHEIAPAHDDLELLVLLFKGDGTFAAAPTPSRHSPPEHTPHSHNLVLADVSGDGRLDIVQAQSDRNAVLILAARGASEIAGPPSPGKSSSGPLAGLV